jgi:hypothetical protein
MGIPIIFFPVSPHVLGNFLFSYILPRQNRPARAGCPDEGNLDILRCREICSRTISLFTVSAIRKYAFSVLNLSSCLPHVVYCYVADGVVEFLYLKANRIEILGCLESIFGFRDSVSQFKEHLTNNTFKLRLCSFDRKSFHIFPLQFFSTLRVVSQSFCSFLLVESLSFFRVYRFFVPVKNYVGWWGLKGGWEGTWYQQSLKRFMQVMQPWRIIDFFRIIINWHNLATDRGWKGSVFWPENMICTIWVDSVDWISGVYWYVVHRGDNNCKFAEAISFFFFSAKWLPRIQSKIVNFWEFILSLTRVWIAFLHDPYNKVVVEFDKKNMENLFLGIS